jgi:hypothetical protein
MAYIGNSPEVNTFIAKVDKFSGTGACTQFTLSRTVDDANAIQVIVNSVYQTPIYSYSVAGGVVTFTEAPSLGTENILVNYTSPITLTFNQVTSAQIQAGAVGVTQLAANSVTSEKIAPGAVIVTDISDGSVTGPKLGLTSISTNNIMTGAITGNLIPNDAISGNNIVANAIRGNNIVAGQITGNLISVGAITGNLIANNAISGNNIVTPPDIFDDAFLFGGM